MFQLGSDFSQWPQPGSSSSTRAADQSSPIILSPYEIQRHQQRMQLHEQLRGGGRVTRRDEVTGTETRSELIIRNASLSDNGTYHCEASNKAARAVSNFTLHVTSVVDAPEILQVKVLCLHEVKQLEDRIVLPHTCFAGYLSPPLSPKRLHPTLAAPTFKVVGLARGQTHTNTTLGRHTQTHFKWERAGAGSYFLF